MSHNIPGIEQGQELSLPDALRMAVGWHQEGRVQAAAEVYRRILEQVPDHIDALHFLGVALHQSGRSEEGIATIRHALALAPDSEGVCNNLGNIFKELGCPAEAEQAYRRVIECRPDNADAHNNLGVVLKEQGRLHDAVSAYQQAIALQPNHTDAWHNLGNALKKAGQIDEALTAYRRAITLRPYHTEAYKNLGRMLYVAGRAGEAAAVYSEWLAREPNNPVARHLLAACSGQNVPKRAGDDYIVTTFDTFAATFDTVLERLDYRAHLLVTKAAAQVLGEQSGGLEMLDAGCGTGLCGPLLRPYAHRMTGLDLSPRMIDKASGRGVYDELIAAELTAYLSGQTDRYDLIVSADTLCYFGDLSQVVIAAAGALRSGALLVFTLEAGCALPPEGYQLQPHGRYKHAIGYVQQTLTAAGFQIVSIEEQVLRNEAGNPVAGLVITSKRHAGSLPVAVR